MCSTVLLALALALAYASPALAAKSVPVKTWASSVCSSFSRWQQGLEGPVSVPDAADSPAATKALLVGRLKLATKDTRTLIRRLKAAGAPDVRHGQHVAAALLDAVTHLSKTLDRTRRASAALDATSPTFVADVAALQQREQEGVDTLVASLTAAVERNRVPTLDTALQTASSCRAA